MNVTHAQDMQDFVARIQVVYENVLDTAKAEKLATELFKSLESDQSDTRSFKYQMLLPIFENIVKNPELAEKCRELSNVSPEITTPSVVSGGSALEEWNNQLYPKLFTNEDPDNATKALQFLEKHPDLHDFNKFNYTAYAFENNGNYEMARKLYEKAISFVKDDSKEFYSYAYYTNFLSRSGEYLKAASFIQKIENLSANTISYLKSSYTAESLTTKTVYYSYIGDYVAYIEAAEKQYEHFDQLYNANYGCNPNPMTLSTIKAHSYELLGELKKAKSMWKRRDDKYNEWIACHNGKFPDSRQLPLSMYPVFLSKTGQLTEIDQPVSNYINEVKAYYGSFEEYATVNVKNYKAQHLGFLSDPSYHSAYQNLLKEIKLRKDFTEATLPFAYYGYFCSRDRQIQQANEAYSEMMRLNLEWINDLISTFGEKAFVTYYNTKIKEGYDNYHSFVKILYDRKHQLFASAIGQDYDNLLMTKSIGFKGTQKKKDLFLKSNDQDVIEMYEEWIGKKRNLINFYQQLETKDKPQNIPSGGSKEELKQLQQEVEDLENQLADKAKDFKKYLKIETPTWKDIQNRLKAHEAAVEMVRFNWRDQLFYSDSAYYAAYIIKKDSKHPEVVYLPTLAYNMDERYYKGYQNSIKLKLDDTRSYDVYWKTIKEKLDGIEKIYFSPDGIYHLINLPTLKNPESGQFLLEEVEIQYVTSTSNVLNDQTYDVQTSTLIGRPAYQMNQPQPVTESVSTRSFVRNFRGQEISDLPGTQQEIEAVQEVLKSNNVSVQYYLSENATEDKVYQIKSPGILHIATHGYWSETEGSTPGFRMFNAMVNSGLLLAGVVNFYNQPTYQNTHDGILTAYEAQNLNLENTELVILSACETGLGKFDAGEGVYGLQRGFRSAGAKSIVTSLWKVDDEATRDFMIHFYQQMFESKDKLEAFRSAQLAMKEKYREPYYWGAFVLSGI